MTRQASEEGFERILEFKRFQLLPHLGDVSALVPKPAGVGVAAPGCLPERVALESLGGRSPELQTATAQG